MSGLCGIFHLTGRPVGDRQIASMNARLAHRGPDGNSLWHEGCVGLGHQHLWNTPESKLEALPTVHANQQWAITADARIDNRTALIEQLLPGSNPAKVTDSTLIVEAYGKWGEQCPQHLLGDFAFAIWDKSKRRLFLARDHFGVKPLYYFCNAHLFAFATEVKALLALPEIPQQLNPVRVADYLAGLFEDTSTTFYKDIFRLPAAHHLQVSVEGVRKQAYWQLDPNRKIVFSTDQDYAEALKEQFEAAVRCRLRSAYPVGAMLSGGLDSSSVVCVARDLLAQADRTPLKTFSAIFERVSQCDERPFIQAVTAQGRLKSYYVVGDRLSPLGNLSKLFWHQDEAFYAPNLFLHCALYERAQAQQVRTVLDGFDGDTTISHGLPYLGELARSGQWNSLLREVRGVSNKLNRPIGPLLWKYGWQQGLQQRSPDLLRRGINRLHREITPSKYPTLRLQPEFAKSVAIGDRIQALRQRLARAQQSAQAAHAERLGWGVLPFTLEVADRAAAAHGIEPRFPFFDKRLVEFCLAIPPTQKIHNGWTRWVMRRAMNNSLPVKVQWRSGKSDLSPNFHNGLRRYERDRISRTLREETDLIEPYVDVALLQRTYQRFLADGSMSDSDVLSIWKPVTLALWLKHAGFG